MTNRSCSNGRSLVEDPYGARSAFLALCWLPMLGLMLTVGLHHHLGYDVLALLAAVLAGSLALFGVGAFLCGVARQSKTEIASLVGGTLLAGLPLALFGGWLIANFM